VAAANPDPGAEAIGAAAGSAPHRRSRYGPPISAVDRRAARLNYLYRKSVLFENAAKTGAITSPSRRPCLNIGHHSDLYYCKAAAAGFLRPTMPSRTLGLAAVRLPGRMYGSLPKNRSLVGTVRPCRRTAAMDGRPTADRQRVGSWGTCRLLRPSTARAVCDCHCEEAPKERL
jgi:hypothetical protein